MTDHTRHPEVHQTRPRLTALALLLVTLAPPLHAQEAKPPSLREASLEELMRVEVTSVSKRQEQLPQAMASSGFNNRFANKMLVLIDGRSVYSSLFSGVFWDIQDTMLEDVERIEVIRGPGATMWGANAVNGVINIITRDAAGTQVGLASVGVGSLERGFGSARYGMRIGDHAHLRVNGRLTAFVNRYDELRSFEPERPQPFVTPTGPMLIAPLRFGNNLDGTARGAEAAVNSPRHRCGSRVRFEVNLRAAERAGLKFSSRLLRMARLVDRRSRGDS